MRLATIAVAMLAVSATGCTSIMGRFSQPYTIMSGIQLDSLINSVDWVDGNTRYRCTNASCTDSVPVRIDANKSSYPVDSTNAGTNGVLVARVRNMGSDTTYMYHFKPAPYRYYFLVKRSGAGSIWILLEKHGGSAPDSVDSGHFTGCWDHPPATSARADFRKCDPRRYPALGRPAVAAFTSPSLTPARESRPTAASEAGAWIGCAYGCCPMASAD